MIRIGNLALGGTGKTPFTEYVLRNFKADFNFSVLSRGYGREGDELKEVHVDDKSKMSGDEPLQIKKKFPAIPVVLNGNRAEGIHFIQEKYADCDCVLLDDALQHRRLKGGMQIMLTTLQNPFFNDFIFPSGRLRDIRSRAGKYDVIVFTKIKEEDFDLAKRNWLLQATKKYNKPVFFTSLSYDKAKRIQDQSELANHALDNGLLITGIAHPEPLLDHVQSEYGNCQHLRFKDHYEFKKEDILKIKEKFDELNGESVIFTSEKDAQRLISNVYFNEIAHLPIYSIAIKIKFLENEEAFKTLIKNYVRDNQRGS